MKKFLTLIFTLAVACSLSLPVFAQAGASTSKESTSETTKTKAQHHKKGGKKSKKGSPITSTSSTNPK